MTFKKLLLIGLSIFVCGQAIANEGAKAEAEKLLSTMGLEAALKSSIEKMLDLQIQQKPTMQPYRATMLKFFEKYMSYDSIKPELVAIYAAEFTEQELKEINAFYQTDTGKKTIEKMPLLMAKGGQLGMSRVQQNLPELQKMVEAEALRLQELQAASPEQN